MDHNPPFTCSHFVSNCCDDAIGSNNLACSAYRKSLRQLHWIHASAAVQQDTGKGGGGKWSIERRNLRIASSVVATPSSRAGDRLGMFCFVESKCVLPPSENSVTAPRPVYGQPISHSHTVYFCIRLNINLTSAHNSPSWFIGLGVSKNNICSLMSFFVGNQDKFLTNSSVHSINTRNKHHLHRPIANLSCFQKGASYSGIRIFNNLPQNITSLRNEKPQFKVAIIFFFYMHTPFTLWMNFLHVQMICITYMTVPIFTL